MSSHKLMNLPGLRGQVAARWLVVGTVVVVPFLTHQSLRPSRQAVRMESMPRKSPTLTSLQVSKFPLIRCGVFCQ